MAAGAVSLKLPNFLTTSQDVTKGADQAKNDDYEQFSKLSISIVIIISNSVFL